MVTHSPHCINGPRPCWAAFLRRRQFFAGGKMKSSKFGQVIGSGTLLSLPIIGRVDLVPARVKGLLMQRKLSVGVLALICVLALPVVAKAQSQITGQVKDESGGVLPGVTVEAASPVLIEKVKTVVTDDQGRYTIVDLRPGTYKVTFTLTGFATVVRDGIELLSNFTATVNADLKVGALAETITVSGVTPQVD